MNKFDMTDIEVSGKLICYTDICRSKDFDYLKVDNYILYYFVLNFLMNNLKISVNISFLQCVIGDGNYGASAIIKNPNGMQTILKHGGNDIKVTTTYFSTKKDVIMTDQISHIGIDYEVIFIVIIL